ncbi:Ja06 [Japanese cytomegalovirus]|nr:Ja06 [Japanese cytomegalovirus]
MVKYVYYISFLLHITESTINTHNYSVPAGNGVTLVDFLNSTTDFRDGTWFFTKSEGRCEAMSSLANRRKLCKLYYHVQEHNQVQLIPACRELFKYSCNMTALHIHNVTDFTPTDYSLAKVYDNGTTTTQYYHLQIVFHTTVTPQMSTAIHPPPRKTQVL